ncbi:MAG TPA: amino acid adenylation domain-containing protein [Candidatus Angelobacter sp.]|jgi:amino acid adenylation domain-containing protein
MSKSGETSFHRLHRTIPEIFEEQVRQTPDTVAVVYEGSELTYRELNERANQLAHYLHGVGVKPGARVGICVERSLEMVVGVLGILKTGAAYVPLDRNYPQERLSYMVEDAEAEVLLVQQRLLDKVASAQSTIVVLEDEHARIAQQSKANPPSQCTPDHLAYVIYTSGSTGRPKGVCICHRNAVRLVSNTNYADLGPDQVFLQFVSISFDVAAFEIWAPLLNGARLLIFPAYTPSAEELGEWILEHPVTTLWLTSGLFHHLMEMDNGRYFIHLRQLLAGGDALSLRAVQKFLKLYPNCRLINGYGPTENGTFSTCGELREMAPDAAAVPIGRAIACSTAFVLDAQMRQVPVSESGEIYLGGSGLAHGYWNQPALTAARFVPNPFSDTPGERLYKSGDLGRSMPDGNLEFLGRIDQQVKLRGYRIELGEIEAVLEQNPNVAQAVALVREDSPGDRRLVAYVVPHQEGCLRTGDLRDYLIKKLPEYMVPTAFVLLDTLPLTANGKVDRRALPLPKGERPALEQPYVAPGTATETMLAGVWAEVLRIDRVGAQDSFFDLGGNSLLAAQVMSRVRKSYGVSLPLRSFFEKPVLADLARRFEAEQRVASLDQVAPIGAVQRGEEIPLGFSQERVWFLQELDPSSIAYNFQATLRIRGPLNIAALEQSLTEIIARHEIFRTTFVERHGHPLQIVHDAFPVRLPVVDLQGVAREQMDNVVAEMVKKETASQFDVGRLPLIRWALFSLGEQEHILLHIEHHFVHDGWGFNVFLGELLEIYKARAAGEPSPLAPPRVQFADYAVWQRQYVRSERVQAQLSFWKSKLAGSLPMSALPTDRPRPSVQTFNGRVLRIPLSTDLCRSLHAFSNQEEASLFVIMMSAFFTLAYRYTRQGDFCVGTSLANRQRPETEGLLGMLVNNVVLRAQMDAGLSFRDLLAQVRELTFEAYENQDVPLQDVVRAVNVNRDLRVNPLFQTTFNFHNSPVFVPEIPELQLQLVEALGNGAAKFDLGVIVIPASTQRLRLNPEWDKDAVVMLWEYNTDLFDESTIRRSVKHYEKILAGMIADPLKKITEAGLMDEAERQLMLVEWNQTTREAEFAKCVHELFAEQAKRTPQSTAVAHGQQSLTYAELDRQSNQAARYLRKLGVRPEVRVGVCMERTLEWVVALLGILKAGGAYVPLDANYPAERLAYMVEDSQLALVLTQQKTHDRLGEVAGDWVCLDQRWAEIAKQDDGKFAGGATPENLVYVIYTSGSTGKPKGVGVPHRGLENLITWHQKTYELTPADRATQVASQAFDASVWEMWPYLLSGSSLDLPDQEVLDQPAKLFEWLAERKITICFLPTPLAEVLGSTQPLPKLHLRALLTGGDKLHEGPWSSLPCPITNHYGPTENTVVSTCIRANSGSVPPIGKPIANVRAYVLDEAHQPVPIGVAGELHVGGASLARGYVNRPGLTAERFVPDPFSNVPGERLYQTGDVVRFLADGNLEFLGRKDHQVKLRGYRIELGEIESALAVHPQVKHAVAMVREDGAAEKRLVAYVVPQDRSTPLDTNELRVYLQGKLPAYMVPAAWVELHELPLTTNGKVNRQALPAPQRRAESQRRPRTPREETLCEILAEVLSMDRVGIDDDFFALGGHSLMATRVVSQVRAALGVELSLRTIFAAPTVGEMSRHLGLDQQPVFNTKAYANPAAVRRG